MAWNRRPNHKPQHRGRGMTATAEIGGVLGGRGGGRQRGCCRHVFASRPASRASPSPSTRLPLPSSPAAAPPPAVDVGDDDENVVVVIDVRLAGETLLEAWRASPARSPTLGPVHASMHKLKNCTQLKSTYAPLSPPPANKIPDVILIV